ncbi:hypothetical protein K488DRAFT_66721 [Vararia minispora EC-137]|uniref:Uncharacterized protein n=1 Tax=Vararia minispora EC-137 TaxID=1314806 RepID=A0ACB8Q426_9AGAM|nr:hypothetical protein K488DRAFT_66721 [Vararia minispora EC-137]
MPLPKYNAAVLERWLAELQLLKHSLLPDEYMSFQLPSLEASAWETALIDASSEQLQQTLSSRHAGSVDLHVNVGIAGSTAVWLDIGIKLDHEVEAELLVKGDTMGRENQMRWQEIIRIEREKLQSSTDDNKSFASEPEFEQTHHALLTSHHLVSPTKRRSMQRWASQLRLVGFAKIGHPGVIYCSGTRTAVEEFVGNVKAMQWLALRTRFLEPLSESKVEKTRCGRWAELEKVRDVAEEMRRLGREAFVVEMGVIGTASSTR